MCVVDYVDPINGQLDAYRLFYVRGGAPKAEYLKEIPLAFRLKNIKAPERYVASRGKSRHTTGLREKESARVTSDFFAIGL